MGTIQKRLEHTRDAMKIEANRDPLGLKLKQAAIAAMMEGIGPGGDWEKYMSLFADNEEQLQRLTVPHNEDPAYLREARAYIVANAICGADSTTDTSLRFNPKVNTLLQTNNADGKIVDPGQPAPAGTRVRPFKIP